MDPTEVRERFTALAAEFPNISELIPLPYETNGYQRRAQANMAGSTTPGGTPTGPGSTPPGSQTGATVVLTSRAWGHEGGNLITAEFLNPGIPDSPLTVAVIGNDISVSLTTDATGALTSTLRSTAIPARARSWWRSPTAATWARASFRPALR
jgi:hypothetical protein